MEARLALKKLAVSTEAHDPLVQGRELLRNNRPKAISCRYAYDGGSPNPTTLKPCCNDSSLGRTLRWMRLAMR